MKELLLTLAISLGVAEPRETWLDAQTLTERIAEAPTLPPLSDAADFPPGEWLHRRAVMWGEMARLYERGAMERLHHAEELSVVAREFWRREDAIFGLALAANECLLVYDRRKALKEYKRRVGPELYEVRYYP